MKVYLVNFLTGQSSAPVEVDAYPDSVLFDPAPIGRWDGFSIDGAPPQRFLDGVPIFIPKEGISIRIDHVERRVKPQRAEGPCEPGPPVR
jgi:hypothetical protein